MGDETGIPFLEFSGEALEKGWGDMCGKVRKACEVHGCFMVSYDAIPRQLREELFVAMKTLFDLPEDTKKKYESTRPFCSYKGKCSAVPLLESFGIEAASKLDKAQAFTNLMWPHGNPSFCATLNSMSSKMLELNLIILKMIFESFGMNKYYCDSRVENTASIFRLMKYKVPLTDNSVSVGLVAHTDKNFLTIICQNEVQGLEVLTKEDNWSQVMAPEGSFIVVIGDMFKAWSNGRLHAAKHRVMMSGDKERYSCGVFVVPKEGAKIEVPQELIDNDHPLLYRPFIYTDFMSYFVSNISDNALEIYAGV